MLTEIVLSHIVLLENSIFFRYTQTLVCGAPNGEVELEIPVDA